MPQALRPYQVKGYSECRSNLAQGIYKILVVLPTGGGKTTLASHIIHSAVNKGSHVLFLAHRKELILQASRRLDDEGIDHGIIKAKNKRYYPLQPVQVASVPTLARRPHQMPRADLIVLDEAHHVNGKTWLNLLSHYPDAVVLGLTATPFRTDGSGLGSVFNVIVNPVSMQQLIDEKVLVPYRVFSTPMEPEWKKVKVKRGEFDNKAVEKIVNTTELVGDIYAHWKTHAEGRQTVIFANSLKHALRIKADFLHHGVPTEYLDANTPDDERDNILARITNRETRVVVNMGILTEGWDCPIISCVVLARPTKSCGLYIQMGGRGLRAFPGKDDCIILDHGGNTARFGFLADDREYSLEGRPYKEKTAAEINVRTCKNCFAIFRGPACAACGQGILTEERDVLPETKDGALEELDQVAERNKQRTFYASLLERAKAGNYKIEWANHQFKKVYGRYPSPTVTRGLVRKDFERVPLDGGNFTWKFRGYIDVKKKHADAVH